MPEAYIVEALRTAGGNVVVLWPGFIRLIWRRNLLIP